jgi:hypothetical protein
MNIDNEIINRAAKEMSDDIDFEVMSHVLCQEGWTKVILQPMTIEKSEAIDKWISECKGRVHTRGLVFIFEQARNATWFALKFGGPQYE